MKNRFFALVSIIGILFLITGCGGTENKKVEGTLEELMTKVYDGIAEDKLPMGLTNMEVTKETVEGFLGTTEIEYKEALARESMVGAIAHSVVLVRANDAKDVETLKNTIKENVNPRKWVCVGVEPENVIIKNKGDLIIVIIVEDEFARTEIEKGFDKL